MDYNDNDYEGQNLHLIGEESSKISSVLRPFALPKYDFDDSLQGHLRFDSLVENEVFLGIPSQEDNQWIEDFSQGSSGIVFSSSAAESCSLPRHTNVWSEATSSESVEMLLKAVRQEEMVPGENLMEESEPGVQLGSSTQQMENNVRQDTKIDDAIDHGNSSLPPAEVDETICRSNQSAGVEVIQDEYDLQGAKIDDGIIDYGNPSSPPADVEGNVDRSNQSARVEVIQAEYDLQDAKIDDDIDHVNSSLPLAEVEGTICRSDQCAGVEVIQDEYGLQDAKIDDVIVYGGSSLPPAEVEGNICRSNQSAGVEVIQADYDLPDAKIDSHVGHGNSSLPPVEVEGNVCRSNQSAGVEIIQADYESEDAKIDGGIDYENSLLLPAEVEVNICRSNQSAGVEVVQAEYDLRYPKIDDMVYENSSLPPVEVEGNICRSNRGAGVEIIQADYELEEAKIDDGIEYGNSSLLPAEVEVNICRSNQSAGVEVVQAEYDLQDPKIDDIVYENSSSPPVEVEGNICRSNQSVGIEIIQADYEMEDGKIDDGIDYGNSSLLHSEVEANICGSNQSAGVEVVQAEYDLQDPKIDDIVYENSSSPPVEVEGNICRSNQSVGIEIIQADYEMEDGKIDDGIDYGNSSLLHSEVEANICGSNQSAGVEVVRAEYDLQNPKIVDIDYENSSLPSVEVEGYICRSNQSAGVEIIQADYESEDAKIDDGIDYGNSSLLPAEGEVNICRSNQSAGVEVVLGEYDLQAEANVSIYGVCTDDNGISLTENSGNPETELKMTSDNQVSPRGLVSESPSTNVQENIPVICTEIGIEQAEISSQNVPVSVKESLDQEKIIDIGFVSPVLVTEAISPWVGEQEEGGGIAIENDGTESHCFHKIPSEMEFPKEDHSDEMCIGNLAEASSVLRIAETISTRDRCNEGGFVVEPSGGSQPIPEVSSSGTEIKHLSEGCTILHDNTSVSLRVEDIVGLKVEESDDMISTIHHKTELNQVPVNQQSHQSNTPVDSEDFHPGSHDSFDAPHGSFGALGTPDKVGGANHEDVPDTVRGSNFDYGSCGEESVIGGMNDAGNTDSVQNEDVEDGDPVALPLVSVSVHTSTIDTITMQLDACEDDSRVTVHEKDVKKLPLDSSDSVCDGHEKEMSLISALNEVEYTKLTSSYVEGDGLVEGNQHKSPSCDMEIIDLSEETESQAPKQPLTSVSKDSLESNEATLVFESEKGALPDSEAGKSQTSNESVFLVETSIAAMPGEGHKELSAKMDNSSSDLIAQDGGTRVTHTENPIEAGGKISGSNSSTVPVTGCDVEMDQSNQSASPAIITDLPQPAINNQASLKRDDENIVEVLTTSKISGVNVLSKEAEHPIHSTVEAASPSTPGSGQVDAVELKEVSHASPSLPSLSGGARCSSERKVKRVNSKSVKESASKGDHGKKTTPLTQTEKWEKPSQFLSPLGSGHVTFDSAGKPRGFVSTPTSSLPDLNTSAPSTFFQQPFTDLQQVQLRAQIFVYGSLIQGAAPDSGCMISAFDGGRDIWEPSWRACVDRLHGEKSLGKNTETPVTPVSLRSGVKTPNQAKRQGSSHREAFTRVAGRANNMAITSPVVNPMISLSSPLWNTSTPSTETLPSGSIARNAVNYYQTVSPLNPFQAPSMQNYVTHPTWSSQAPFPVPWLAPSQTSAYDISTNPAFPNSVEPIKLSRSKESPLTVTPSTKHASPIPTTHTEASTTFGGDSSIDLKKLKVSTEQTADTKTRKRKKSSGAEDAVHIPMTTVLDHTVSAPVIGSQLSNKGPFAGGLSQISPISQYKGDQMPAPAVISHYSTSVAVATPSRFVQSETANQFFSMVSPSNTSDQVNRGDLSVGNKVLNVECFSKVGEAKFQAQEAAAHAAAAVSQCEGVWSLLGQQNNSGLTLDAQSKLSSAAVAIAAAAAVAKAAAAAAKIASTAALQAKQMADEAVTESETVNSTGDDAILVSNTMNLETAFPVSIFHSQGRNNAPSLAISAAREASKKRIEAASAATRHAENLDAIVKAAELAAEAVSHAGKIVAMGEPFSLSELAEAGPNSYWKVSKAGDDKNTNIANYSGELPDAHMNQDKGPDKDMHVTSDAMSPSIEISKNVVDDYVIEDNIMASGNHGDNFKPQKDAEISDSVNTVLSDSDTESRSTSYTLSGIKEGSYVEVLKDRGDLKNVWFSANVLRLKDGEVLVSYNELPSDEGTDPLKEWISIGAKDGEAPKVRIPHEMTAVLIEGTRKRGRAAAKDYTWSVGDKVDAWVQNCWREGVISEINKNEATSLSVHFPVQGDTLMVKVWHLRPTLIWSDGRWVEWCGLAKNPTFQGDTPVKKRPKLTEEKAKGAKDKDLAELGRNEVPRLPLSANEKTFSIGTSKREENKPSIARTMRSGAEKTHSRVLSSIPKPGKKRKFMEVSKHYVSDRVPKTTNDSAKSAKVLTPQGSGSRFKNKSKELQVAESTRTRAIKSGKPPSIPSRTLARKDESTSSRHNTAGSDKGKSPISNYESESGEQKPARSGSESFSNVDETTSGDSVVFGSQALPNDNNRKKTAARSNKSGRPNPRKLPSPSGNPAKREANERLVSEGSEPRRSIRRIQPTSRLLEGIQSSLTTSRIPLSSSREKGNVSTLNKGGIRGNHNGNNRG